MVTDYSMPGCGPKNREARLEEFYLKLEGLYERIVDVERRLGVLEQGEPFPEPVTRSAEGPIRGHGVWVTLGDLE